MQKAVKKICAMNTNRCREKKWNNSGTYSRDSKFMRGRNTCIYVRAARAEEQRWKKGGRRRIFIEMMTPGGKHNNFTCVTAGCVESYEDYNGG